MVTGKVPVLHGICVGKTDTTTMRFTHTSYLLLPQLSLSKYRIHILPDMKDICVISVGQLCDDRFAVNFNNKNFFLRKGSDVLTGYRDATTGLYLIGFDRAQPLPVVSNHAHLPSPTSHLSPLTN